MAFNRGEAAALKRYPFFYNPKMKELPQALSDAALYDTYRSPGKSWRSKVAKFRLWWVKAANGVAPGRGLEDPSQSPTRWCVPAGLVCGRLPQRYCRRLFCPFCYFRSYVAPTYLRLLDVKGKAPIALRTTSSAIPVPPGEHWTDHVSAARPKRPRGADLAYLIVPGVDIAPIRSYGRHCLDDDIAFSEAGVAAEATVSDYVDDDAPAENALDYDSEDALYIPSSNSACEFNLDHEADEYDDDDDFDIYGDGPVFVDVAGFDVVAEFRWHLWTREIRVMDLDDSNCTVVRTSAELARYVGRSFCWPRNWRAIFDLPASAESAALRYELLTPRGYAGGRLYACSGRLRKKGPS